MSIVHIEDLPVDQFIKAVRNISSFKITEKLDGANLWMGLDDAGKLFTSRQGKRKGAKNFYSEEEYPHFAAYNGFRGAQAALEAKLDDIKRVMQPGQTVEMEIMFGRQPNAVTYGAEGKSYIAFLRGVEGTPDVVADQLAMSLGNQSVTVNVALVDTTDGINLDLTDKDITYQFTGAQNIPSEKLKDVHLSGKLDELEAYLRDSAGLESDPELTNLELVQNSLGSIPIDVRPAAKDLKAQVLAKIYSDFKLPIKKELLGNYVQKIKPQLSAADITTDEDVGVEGVVLRDPTTGDMIKIVDKDTFTTINTFNHSVRNQISGVVRTVDSTAPLDARGGIVGNMKIRIADLLGNVDLARGAPAKKILSLTKGTDAVDTIKKFAASLDLPDFLGTKRKVLAVVGQAAKELVALRDDFEAHKDDFQLKLKTGKVIGISPEIEKRTLLVFAETRRNLSEQFDKIKLTKTPAQLLAVLYGHVASAIFANPDDEPVSEGFDLLRTFDNETLLEKKYDTDKARYHGKDAYQLMNIYFATVFMTIIFYKADDAKGIKMMRDKTHYRMTAYAPTMSPLNFWGYPIWHASSPAVKKLIGPKASTLLFKTTRKATPSQPRMLHQDLSFGKDVPISWSDHRKTLHILQQFDGMNTDRINTLMDGVFSYDTLSKDKQLKVLSKLVTYVVQFIPTSSLLIELKKIQSQLKDAEDEDEHDDKVDEMKLLSTVNSLVEDEAEDMAGLAAAGAQVDMATRAADVADNKNAPMTTNKGRMIVKRKRNPAVKKAKFPKPEESTI